METLTEIAIRKTKNSRISEVDFDDLKFGQWTSDHMLICDYSNGKWGTSQIVPFANLSLSPSSLALHYGQTVFEGMKAFRMKDGSVNIFRLDKHYDRFTRSLERMCMAIPPKEIFEDGLQTLLNVDNAWVPGTKGSALYLRPFIYASESRFGIKVSDEYRFVIITGPVPELFAESIKVKVETDYIRASKGGTGFAKCGGNYGGAFYPTQLAKKEGYDQVLWTDGKEDPSIEESGMMNAMFVIEDTLITAPLSDTILDGVTRDSLLTLAGDLGIRTEERSLRVSELRNAFHDGKVTEAFGAGTAAVVAPIRVIGIDGTDYPLPPYHDKSILNQLKTKLTEIRTGLEADVHGWNHII